MTKLNKFNAVGCRRDGIYFPSKFEREIYDLSRIVDPQIIVHPTIPLMPKSSPKGYINPLGEFVEGEKWTVPTWTPDFYSPRLNCYIEAKGKLTESFRLKMKVLANTNIDILESLIVVSNKEKTWEGLKIINIPQFKRFLQQRREAVR